MLSNIDSLCYYFLHDALILMEKIILGPVLVQYILYAMLAYFLRNELEKLANKNAYQLHIPKFEYCTDNAAMIAITGQLKYQNNMFSDFETSANPRLKI